MCVWQVEQKKQHASITEAKQSTLESQLQTEREALERKEKEVLCRSDVFHGVSETSEASTHETRHSLNKRIFKSGKDLNTFELPTSKCKVSLRNPHF